MQETGQGQTLQVTMRSLDHLVGYREIRYLEEEDSIVVEWGKSSTFFY